MTSLTRYYDNTILTGTIDEFLISARVISPVLYTVVGTFPSYTINGTSNPVLTLLVNVTYRFEMGTLVAFNDHPFIINSNPLDVTTDGTGVSFTPRSVGVFTYVCSYHPSMTGSLTVLSSSPSPYVSSPVLDGGSVPFRSGVGLLSITASRRDVSTSSDDIKATSNDVIKASGIPRVANAFRSTSDIWVRNPGHNARNAACVDVPAGSRVYIYILYFILCIMYFIFYIIYYIFIIIIYNI